MSSIFEYASRQKLRFPTSKGELSTEDLWDLSLPSLDVIAKQVNKELKAEAEESFIEVKSTKNTVLENKLGILKHIIKVKLEEKENAKVAAEKRQRLAFLKNLLEEKTIDQLKSLPVEDIQKEIAQLEDANS